MSDQPSIELPDGSPGAVGDAGAALDRVAGGFERGGAVVARATAAVAGWQGQASVSFHGTAASYSEALGAVHEALIGARVAVRRYETRLEDARAKIRALKQDEQDAVERLRTARRQLTQARSRLQDAQQRAATASLAIGSMTGGPDPIGLAEQAAAQRDAREAQDDIDRALKKIEREQQEIRDLRQKAARAHRDLTQDEHDAATEVRAAADQLPDVTLPGGGASPSAYAGTPFGGVGSPFGAGRSWDSAINRARRDEERLYTSNEFGGGQALDQINEGVRNGTIPPRPANFSEMSPAARARYLYQRTGIHPDQDSPGEAADKIVTFLSLLNPGAALGRVGAKRVAADTVGRLASIGRRGKQQRLRALANDPNASSSVRGWIRQDLNEIARGQRKRIRVPPGYELAHRYGKEARRGYGYEYSDLKDTFMHRTQHRIERGSP